MKVPLQPLRLAPIVNQYGVFKILRLATNSIRSNGTLVHWHADDWVLTHQYGDHIARFKLKHYNEQINTA